MSRSSSTRGTWGNLLKGLDKRAWFNLCVVLLGLVLLMDVFTTWYLLGTYGGRELNFVMAPIVAGGLPAMLTLKAVELVVMVGLCVLSKQYWLLWLGLLVASLPVVNNLVWWVVLWSV